MDSAQFIRKRTVFAAWVIVPLGLAALMNLGARSFMERQQLSFHQKQAMERLIPDMRLAAGEFDTFISAYEIASTGTSIEDANIKRVNDSAEATDLVITSINLTQDAADKTPGYIRINMHIKGIGSAFDIASFLKNIHTGDAAIYQKEVRLSRAGLNEALFEVEVVLSKIYIDPKEERL